MNYIHRLAALTLALALGLVSVAAQAQGSAPAGNAPAANAPAPADAAKPAPAPAPPPGAGMDVGTQKEVVENPYGLEALWKQGDFVSRGTLIILIIMSMGSWYIMFVKVYEQMKLFRQAKIVQDSFWQAGSVNEGLNQLKEGTAFRYIGESGVKASEHHEG